MRPTSKSSHSAQGDRGIPNPFVGAEFLMSCAKITQLPADGLPEITFAGRSNAGKSSAMNALCGQKQLARVSKTPGRTQLIRSEEHTSELQSLMRISYAVFCLKKKKNKTRH